MLWVLGRVGRWFSDIVGSPQAYTVTSDALLQVLCKWRSCARYKYIVWIAVCYVIFKLDPEDGYPLRAYGFVHARQISSQELATTLARVASPAISVVAEADIVGSKLNLQDRHLRVDIEEALRNALPSLHCLQIIRFTFFALQTIELHRCA